VSNGIDIYLERAIEKANKGLEGIILPNGYYRLDIGVRLFSQADTLYKYNIIEQKILSQIKKEDQDNGDQSK